MMASFMPVPFMLVLHRSKFISAIKHTLMQSPPRIYPRALSGTCMFLVTAAHAELQCVACGSEGVIRYITAGRAERMCGSNEDHQRRTTRFSQSSWTTGNT